MSGGSDSATTTDHGGIASRNRGEPAGPSDPDIARGDCIGRYLVLDRIAAGGMGVVYRAYDPELDRKVALKMLRPGGRVGDELARTRLLREAQALAKLAHPNVVAVYDVGTVDDAATSPAGGPAVFVAMELVEGTDLRQWARTRTRGRAEILAVFVRAARGLAAAHRVGLWHRDFKPANVLVCENDGDTAVKVADFGLARASRSDATDDPAARDRLRVAATDDPLTASGATAGTPGYIAPEVERGEPGDARADQYAFCVALAEVLRSRTRGRDEPDEALLESLPRATPTWLRRLLAKGICSDPERRFATMDELVVALDRGSRPRRRASAAVLAGVVGAAVWAAWPTSDALDPCHDGTARLAGVWDNDAKQSVRDRVRASELPYANETADRVQAGLDDHTQRWLKMYTDACEATLVRGEQSRALLDARMLCLEHRLDETRALVDVLRTADAAVIERAPTAVDGLAPLDSCGARAALLVQLPAPPDDPAVETIRDALAQVAALEAAGKYDDGMTIAERARTDADALGYRPLRAEAYLREGRLLERRGEFEQAALRLADAHFLAAGDRHEEVAAEAATLLVYVLGGRLGRFDDAREWGQHAEAAVRRVGLGGREEAELLNDLGTVESARGDHEAARELFVRALELERKAFGEDHHQTSVALGNVGIALEELDRFDEAESSYAESLAILERTRGPRHPETAIAIGHLAGLAFRRGDSEGALAGHRRALAIKEASLPAAHPSIGYSHDGIGLALRGLGRFAEARDHHRRAVDVFVAAFGPDHPAVATSLNNLANALRMLGAHDEAEDALQRALAIWRAKLGPEHAYVATALTNLGAVAEARGDLEASIERHEAALAILRERLGPDHPSAAIIEANIGWTEQRRGRLREARERYDRVLPVLETLWPAGHPDVATVLEYRGELALREGRIDDAVADLQRALAIRSAQPSAPVELGKTQFSLARAREEAGAHELARRGAHDALATWRSTQIDPAEIAAIERWLAEH